MGFRKVLIQFIRKFRNEELSLTFEKKKEGDYLPKNIFLTFSKSSGVSMP